MFNGVSSCTASSTAPYTISCGTPPPPSPPPTPPPPSPPPSPPPTPPIIAFTATAYAAYEQHGAVSGTIWDMSLVTDMYVSAPVIPCRPLTLTRTSYPHHHSLPGAQDFYAKYPLAFEGDFSTWNTGMVTTMYVSARSPPRPSARCYDVAPHRPSMLRLAPTPKTHTHT
jgi:hypothetical protein